MKIYLASDSPRRKELLTQIIGSKFSVIKHVHTEDDVKELAPESLAVHHARSKAVSAAKKIKNGIIIAADTIVVLNEKTVLGKPKNSKEAVKMLKKISGEFVQVITGVAVIKNPKSQALNTKQISNSKSQAPNGKIATFAETSVVKITKLSEKEIKAYVRTKEPLDKAGAFGIQGKGAVIVEWMMGDYFNVVGLPLFKLAQLLNMFGVKTL